MHWHLYQDSSDLSAALLCRPLAQDQGQQAVREDCCAWELLQLFYILAPRLEGFVTQVCPETHIPNLASVTHDQVQFQALKVRIFQL